MSAQLNLTTVKLGNNADTSKNFLISVPSVADGTLTIVRESDSRQTMAVDVNGKVSFPQGRSSWNTGEVIQHLSFAVDAGGSTNSTTRVNVSAGAKSITPKSTNSRIIVSVTAFGSVAAGGVGTNTQASFDLSEGVIGLGPVCSCGITSGAGANVNAYGAIAMQVSLTNTALTTRSFSIFGQTSNAAGAANATLQYWTIMEVQQ